MKTIIIIVFALLSLIVFSAMYKSHHFFKAFIITAFQGIVSILAVNIIGLMTGISLAINWYTLSFAGIFGIPGCITLTIMKFITR